jgi:hypothetical protein
MYSSVINGKVEDWRFTKNLVQDWSSFWIDEQLIGQIFKMNKDWSAVSWVNPGNKVDGFRTKRNAACYLAEVYLKSIK